MANEVILEVKDLQVFYGPIQALKGIDIQIRKGEIVALLGANGAGKTTTLRTISGVVRGKKGQIFYNGTDISDFPTEKIARIGVIQSPEGRQVFSDLTVEENMRVGAFTVKSKAEVQANFERCYRYFPVLKERMNQQAGTLSGGEQQMLAIARALMSSAEVLLLDEPSLGLAPLIVRDILNIVKEIANEGVSVLIVEQNAAQTLKIADYGYVLELGRISSHGKAEDLANDEKLIEAYLGS